MQEDEIDPLLPGSVVDKRHKAINLQNWLYPHARHPFVHLDFNSSREAARHYLSSKTGHYFVLGLVALDVSSIFADFVINLFKCEGQWGDKGWDEALEALGVIGLVFSTLFLLELLVSVWAFGWRYFNSKFHCFDAFIIVAGFISDVVLHGTTEEAASLIIILRLWRVFKIIEELTGGAQEVIDHMAEQVRMLENENGRLKEEVVKGRKALEGENEKLKVEISELKKKMDN